LPASSSSSVYTMTPFFSSGRLYEKFTVVSMATWSPITSSALCAFKASGMGDVPSHVANGRALLINDYAALPVQARPPSLLAVAKCAA
jgi:hypothetical protein